MKMAAIAKTAIPLVYTCSSGTQVKLMTPFHAGYLGIGFAATSRGSGECFARSAAVPARPDAWRCTIANAIHDPCFQNILGDASVLACPEPPWTANIALLTLNRPLPKEDFAKAALKDTLPWALEMANGHCSAPCLREPLNRSPECE